MKIINKYGIVFMPFPGNIYQLISIKLFTIYSILKIELFYYRELTEYIRLMYNIILIYLIFTSDNVEQISMGLLLIGLNLDLLYILFHFKLPIINNKKNGDVSLNVIPNEKEQKLTISILYKDKFIFFINKFSLNPYLLLPLLEDCIENPNLEDYKIKFIQNNLLVSLHERS